MTFTPTPEQDAIIEAVRTTENNLLINALAGAAKTTTLELIAKAQPGKPILSLAFNKRIAEEMGKRLPGNVQSSTVNSVGHRTWAAATGKRLIIDKDKTYNLMKLYGNELNERARSEFYAEFVDIKKVIGKAKLSGYVPQSGAYTFAKHLVTWEEFDAEFEEPLPVAWKRIVDEVLLASIAQAYSGTIDFDDQIYMPTLFGGSFPKFPLVMVDEAQDLSALNHEMLKRLVVKRLIAVGDPLQSIYAFRGSVQSGMAKLGQHFAMREMPLSVSFRCPIAVVEVARQRAPHMQYPDWAQQGEVHFQSTADNPAERVWSPEDGSAIICRNNAPLFSMALKLLRDGRGVKLLGADIGPGLVKILKTFADESMPAEKVHEAIDRWEAAMAAKSRARASLADRAECLHVFADAGPTLGSAIAYAEHILSAEGPIQLMSGHKAKGLEFNVVYHLDPWRIPSQYARSQEDMEQELNVRYVITTRAKQKLFHVNTEDYRKPE